MYMLLVDMVADLIVEQVAVFYYNNPICQERLKKKKALPFKH